MRPNLEMLNRFDAFPHQKPSHSGWSLPQIAILNLFIFAILQESVRHTKWARDKKKTCHYLCYFECSLQLAAALIEKTVKDSGESGQTHLNPNRGDHRLATQKHVKNNALVLNGRIMNSLQDERFSCGFFFVFCFFFWGSSKWAGIL